MAAAAVTACTANYRPDPFDLLNADIEALAQDESLDLGESYSENMEYLQWSNSHSLYALLL